MKHFLRYSLFLAAFAIAYFGQAQFPSDIRGSVRVDVNNNGVVDPGDQPLMGASIRLMPQNTLVATDWSGGFRFEDPDPAPHVDVVSVDNAWIPGATVLPTSFTVPVPGPNTWDSTSVFLVQVPAPFADVLCFLAPNNFKAIPDTDLELWMVLRNQGTTVADIAVTFVLDPVATYLAAVVPPLTQVGNTFTWNFMGVAPGAWVSTGVVAHVPIGTPIGSTLSHSLEVSTLGDVNLLNNLDNLLQPVLNAWDPNYKELEPAELTPAQGLAGEEVRYTVHFQNTGNAPATNVVVEDLLPVELDDALQLLGASHYCTWSVTDHLLRVEFPGIMLPDSGADWTGSQGLFTFRTHTMPGLLPGTVVPNEASIYFDSNPAVVTDPCLLSVMVLESVPEGEVSLLTITPNPASDGLVRLTVPTVWSNVQVRVFDASGRMVHGERLASLSPQGALLNLSALQPGGYAVQVTTAEQTSVQRMVIE